MALVECVDGGDGAAGSAVGDQAVQIFENGGAKSDRLYSIEIYWVVMIDGATARRECCTLCRTTILSWVQCFVAEFEKRWSQYARPVGLVMAL
jgi:hypothetical protein